MRKCQIIKQNFKKNISVVSLMNVLTIINLVFKIVTAFLIGLLGYGIPFMIRIIVDNNYNHTMTCNVDAIPGLFLAGMFFTCSLIYDDYVLNILEKSIKDI
jgi:hypothetical protein